MLTDGLHPRDRIIILFCEYLMICSYSVRPPWIQDKMSFILVIGGALAPRQGYEQCHGGHFC